MRPLSLVPAGIDHERLVIGETAVAAAGGGHLEGLHRDRRDPARWSATVRDEAGTHLVVDLDARAGTAVVRPAALWVAA